MRPKQQSAGVQRRRRDVEFNLRPMAWKYRAPFRPGLVMCNLDTIRADRDGFPGLAGPHRVPHGPDQQPDFQARERQHRPESPQRTDARHGESGSPEQSNENTGAARRQGAAGPQLEMACSVIVDHRVGECGWAPSGPGCHPRIHVMRSDLEGEQRRSAEPAMLARTGSRRNAQIPDGKGFLGLFRALCQKLRRPRGLACGSSSGCLRIFNKYK